MRSVVHENVDASHFVYGTLDDVPAVRGGLNIARHEHRLAAGSFDKTRGVMSVLMLVEIGDQHIRAFPRKGDCHCPSNAAVTAGDNGLFAGQPVGPLIGGLAVIRDRPHVSGRAGH